MPNIGDRIRPRDIGRPTTNTLIWAACLDCGRERWVEMADGKPASIRCKSCNGKMPRRRLSGVNHPMWRGGRYIRNDGYLWVKLLGVV